MIRHASSGLSRRIFWMSGRGFVSPFSAFSVSSRSLATVSRRSFSSSFVIAERSGSGGRPTDRSSYGCTDSLLFCSCFRFTFSPPLTAFMSSETGCQECRLGYDFNVFAKLVNQTRKLLQTFPFLSPSCRLFFASLAFFSIHLGSELP